MQNRIQLFSLLLVILFYSCSSNENKKTENQPSISRKDVPEVQIENKAKVSFKLTNKVEFFKSDSTIIQVNVALAASPKERNQGLMGVEKLNSNEGMLFVFEQEQPLSFWMANTPLSLDIIFVNDEFKIVRIHSNTEPFTTTQYNSEKPARYVIEVVGGFCVSNDIIEGTEVGFDI